MVNIGNKEELCRVLVKAVCSESVQPAVKQFRGGLEILGILDVCQANKDTMAEYFVHALQPPLTAERLEDALEYFLDPSENPDCIPACNNFLWLLRELGGEYFTMYTYVCIILFVSESNGQQPIFIIPYQLISLFYYTKGHHKCRCCLLATLLHHLL
jgi:hypothetical protein